MHRALRGRHNLIIASVSAAAVAAVVELVRDHWLLQCWVAALGTALAAAMLGCSSNPFSF